MEKMIIVGLLVLSATRSAQARKISAEHFGLTPETGYLYAVTPDETCDPATDILFKNEGMIEYITKCDSSIIGWVERTANGADLSHNGMGFDLFLHTGNRWNGQPEIINMYTCGSSRDSDLAKDPRFKASRDVLGNLNLLSEVKKQGLSFKIQLFYNEYVLSGKCIGAIDVY